MSPRARGASMYRRVTPQVAACAGRRGTRSTHTRADLPYCKPSTRANSFVYGGKWLCE